MDIKNDSLGSTFISLFDSNGFDQWVHNHILDLVLMYGIKIDHVTFFTHNPYLSDHCLIRFELLTHEYTMTGKHFYINSLSDDSVTKFIEMISLALIHCLVLVE